MCKISWYEKSGYAKQPTISVDKEQGNGSYYGKTTLNGNIIAILKDIDYCSFEIGALDSALGFSSTVGRARMSGCALKVNGGETLILEQKISGIELNFAYCQFSELPLLLDNSCGSDNLTKWCTSVSLDNSAKFVLLCFKKGDGDVEFTDDELSKLPSCISVIA